MSARPEPAAITRGDLTRYCLRVLRQGRGTRPEVRLIEVGRRRLISKDYAACSPLFRRSVARWLVAKESANYRRLAGMAGVAPWVCLVDAHCFVVGYIEGRSCDEMSPGDLSDPAFFGRLNDVVRRLHEAGLVHCDLRYRSNIVVAPGGDPYLVDLVAAFPRRGCFGMIRRWLFALFSEADFQAIAKLKAELAPEHLTPEDIELLSRVRLIERLARAVRGGLLAVLGALALRTPRRRPSRPRRFERYRQPARVNSSRRDLRLAGKR